MAPAQSSLRPVRGSVGASSTSPARNTAPQSAPVSRVALHNIHPPTSWLRESWLGTTNRYERIATASPRMGVGIISHELLLHHVNLLPALDGPGDFLPVFSAGGATLGVRAKIATWPLSKHEAMRNRTFAA